MSDPLNHQPLGTTGPVTRAEAEARRKSLAESDAAFDAIAKSYRAEDEVARKGARSPMSPEDVAKLSPDEFARKWGH